MHIGKRVFINSVRLTEFDLITLEDDACVDDGANLCCHVFFHFFYLQVSLNPFDSNKIYEDGVMTLAPITLHEHALVQPMAVVNPCEIGERATVCLFSSISSGTEPIYHPCRFEVY